MAGDSSAGGRALSQAKAYRYNGDKMVDGAPGVQLSKMEERGRKAGLQDDHGKK